MVTKKRPGVRQVLEELLGGEHPLSYAQLQRLSNLSPEDLSVFRELWSSAPTERRKQIVRALAQLSEDNSDVNFRDVLLYCLGDQEEGIRAASIDGLCDDESISLLERLLKLATEDPSLAVRSQAVLAMGRFAYLVETSDFLESYRTRMLRVLLGIFNDPQATLEMRRRAIETVSYLGGAPEVEEAIAQAYAAPEREMHASAIHAMGHSMDGRWRVLLERELGNEDPEMRYEAAYAVGEIGDENMVPLLAPLIEDPDHEVARAALWALGEIGGNRARRLLERAMQSEEEDIRESAEDALHTLRFFEDPMSMLE